MSLVALLLALGIRHGKSSGSHRTPQDHEEAFNASCTSVNQSATFVDQSGQLMTKVVAENRTCLQDEFETNDVLPSVSSIPISGMAAAGIIRGWSAAQGHAPCAKAEALADALGTCTAHGFHEGHCYTVVQYKSSPRKISPMAEFFVRQAQDTCS